MLPAEHRLRRRPDFVRTVRAGRRAARPALVGHLLTVPGSAGSPGTQVGFVVSRAVGGAVQRNQVRRRLRHLMRERLGALPPGTSLVVRAQPVARDLSAAELAADLDGVLARLTRAPRESGRAR